MKVPKIRDLEDRLYGVMNKLSLSNLPIEFKGALITKRILENNGYSEVSRETKDIDANWTGEHPTMAGIKASIEKSLGDKYTVVPVRNFGERTSARFDLLFEDGSRFVNIDIDVRPLENGAIKYWYGEYSFSGATVEEVVCDKILAISSDKVFRRCKDIVDLYMLSECTSVDIGRINEIAEKKNREIGNFDAVKSRKDDLEHAYNKLSGVKNKPPFQAIYERLLQFVTAFETTGDNQYKWDCTTKEMEEGRGEIWVSPHLRNGHRVRGYWRTKKR